MIKSNKQVSPSKKAVFLDRDGTLMVDQHYLKDPKDIVYLPGVFEALKHLSDRNFHLIIVTNQSGIPRGILTLKDLEAIHAKMAADFLRRGVEFSEIYYAPYLPEDPHPDRKPQPGMLLRGINDFHLDPSECWMVGDKSLDIEAGQRAGVKTIWIRPSLGSSPLTASGEKAHPDLSVESWIEILNFFKTRR
jgi:D-glycero-D-manno-heptose 1,7-bisphosphate phosphatase